MQTVRADDNLITLCRQILSEGRAESEWVDHESDDSFQHGTYEGGFDATEMAFCFSLRAAGEEFWFQITLSEVSQITAGEKVSISVRWAGE